MQARRRMAAAAAAAGAITALGLAAAPAIQAQPTKSVPYLSHLKKIQTIASTVPHNGDVNPYGIFVIRQNAGSLHAGNVLISNFNNKGNLQGTGTTIVQISPRGHQKLFARIQASKLPGSCPGGVGLTTALEVLPGGWVVVGSTPSTNGMAATAKAGCLIVLDRWGHPVETWERRRPVRHERAEWHGRGRRQGRAWRHRTAAHARAAPARHAQAGFVHQDRLRLRPAD